MPPFFTMCFSTGRSSVLSHTPHIPHRKMHCCFLTCLPDICRRSLRERMGRVYDQPDPVFFYKRFDLFFIHASGKHRHMLQITKQALPVFCRHAHKASDPVRGCVFRQETPFGRPGENEDAGDCSAVSPDV